MPANYHDFRYSFTSVLHEPSAQVARLSVLWPILVTLAGSENGQIEGLQRLLFSYRERLLQLFSFEFERVQGVDGKRLEFARNCWPSMGLIERTDGTNGSTCKMANFCPWCYGRRVIRLFNAVARNASTYDHKLVAVSGLLPGATSSTKTLQQLIEWHRRNLVAMVKGNKEYCDGIYHALSIEPDKEVVNEWVFRYRVLALMGRKHDHNFFCVPDKWVRVYDRPQLEDIKPAVQVVSRYPSELMHGSPERVAELLNVLANNFRLTESSGCFRQKKEEEDQ